MILGGGTTILSGFEQLSKSLEQLSDRPTTIIFVSDGQDTTGTPMETLSRQCTSLPWLRSACNVMCWGIGSGFPTALSMGIRSAMHTGPTATPPLVLMESPYTCTAADIDAQVATLIEHAGFVPTTLEPAVALLPWAPMTTSTTGSGSSVFVPSECTAVTVNGITFRLVDHEPSVNEMIEVVRAWVSSLQLQSLKEPFAVLKPKAEQALACVQAITAKRRDAEAERVFVPRETVQQRVATKQARAHEIAWNILVRELRELAEGNVLSNLTDQQLAQRLKIGTITGSHHDKAMQLRGIDTADFLRIRGNSVSVLNLLQLPAEFECSQAGSVFSLENTADVLRQAGLAQVIGMLDSQYELIELFPLIGDGVYIHRSNGSMINPFLIRVDSVARVAQVLDSHSLQRQNNSIGFAIGEGDTETINAIIPLFTAADAPMAAYIASDLFKMLVHFQVMGNIDTYDSNTYLAALASLWCHFVTLPHSTYRTERLQKVVETAQLAYGKNKGWAKYMEMVSKGSVEALVTDHPSSTVKCENLTKVFLAHAISGVPQCSAAETNAWLTRIVTEFLARAIPTGKDLAWFTTRDMTVDDAFAAEVVATVPTQSFMTIRHMNEAAMAQVRAHKAVASGVVLDMERVQKLRYFNLDFPTLIASLTQLFGAEAVNEVTAQAHLTRMLCSAVQVPNSHERNTAPLLDNTSKEHVKATLLSSYARSFQAHFEQWGLPQLTTAFRHRFAEEHVEILPLTRHELAALCQQLNLDVTVLQRSRSGLLRNACCSRTCAHFLQPMPCLAEHMRDGWGETPTPAFHVALQQYPDASMTELTRVVVDGSLLRDLAHAKNSADLLARSAKFPQMLADDRMHATRMAALAQGAYAQWTQADRDELSRDAEAAQLSMRKSHK